MTKYMSLFQYSTWVPLMYYLYLFAYHNISLIPSKPENSIFKLLSVQEMKSLHIAIH